MIIKIENYNLGRKIAALALTRDVEKNLENNKLEAILLERDNLFFWKDNIKIPINDKTYNLFNCCDNYDVFQIDEKGEAYLFYNNEAIDNVFILTDKCNSNCIMCPVADNVRKNGHNSDMKEIMEIIRYIPTDPKHLTITGGEPFLVGRSIFNFLEALKVKFTNTEFLFLTNGRALCIEKYAKLFNDSAPINMITGIPIHGHNEKLHDKIIRVNGGFRQTVNGIKNLLKYNRRVEIRIVVSRINHQYISEISDLIINEFPNIDSVKIMGMEMTGNAALNRNELWLSYRDAFLSSKDAINKLVHNKIDVALYNFPLCSVEKSYQMLCRRSITDYKVRYAQECENCALKKVCGGIFAGTYKLAQKDIVPEVNE